VNLMKRVLWRGESRRVNGEIAASPAAPAPRNDGRGRRRADYDAVGDKRKRTAPRTILKSEDEHLSVNARRALVATARDQARNISLAAWMIRKHLDYVSHFNFQMRTEDTVYNEEAEAFIEEAGRPRNFDVAARHDRQRMMRLLEAGAVIDGDNLLIKLLSGQVQAIEGDRIDKPHDLPPEHVERKFVHGVEVSAAGRALNYLVCKRDGPRKLFDRLVRASNVIAHGYFTRFDQVRGVSPLSTAINTTQDLYEGFDYNLIKAKLHALFGVAILKDKKEGVGGFPVTDSETTGEEATDSETGTTTHQVTEHFVKPGVASILDLDPGDTVEILESKSPSGEFKDFSELMIRVALLALDIPYIFFDSMRGSYSVHRTDAIQYEKSCWDKRRAMERAHDEWTVWRLILADERGEFRLPRGWEIRDAQWEWTPDGTPWIDPLKEVKAALEEMGGGLNSPQRICKKRGLDYFEVIDEIAVAQEYAKSKGVVLSFTPSAEAAALVLAGERGDDDER